MVLCHDMTRIIPGEFKERAFKKGHVVQADDVEALLRMGKENLYVWEVADMVVVTGVCPLTPMIRPRRPWAKQEPGWKPTGRLFFQEPCSCWPTLEIYPSLAFQAVSCITRPPYLTLSSQGLWQENGLHARMSLNSAMEDSVKTTPSATTLPVHLARVKERRRFNKNKLITAV